MGWSFVQPPHGERARAGLGEEVQELRARGRARRLARPGASRGRARRHERSPASCNIPTWTRRSRPICSQLKLLMALYERYDRAIATEAIHEEIAERLREELDYTREAAHMRLYPRSCSADENDVHVPEPVPELSTAAAAHHELARGRALPRRGQGHARRAQRHRAQHVPRLVRAVLFLRRHPWRPASRQLHGARRTTASTCLDFGCIRIFPPRFRAAA